MKKILLSLALVLAGSSARAATIATLAVRNITPNSLSCSSMTFSSATVTELTGNTTAPISVPVYWLSATTLSPSATAYFSHSISVSSFGANIGFPVYPWLSSSNNQQPPTILFEISPLQKFYATGGAAVTVEICTKK